MAALLASEILPGILADFPEISLVYLFGSQVSGQVGPISDYDLAVLHDSLADRAAFLARFQHALVIALGTDHIDLVELQQAPIELAYHIISAGSLLYKRDTLAQVEFEARVLSLYFDYLPILRAQRVEILQGGANGKRVQRYREALRRTLRTLKPPGSS